MSDMHEALYAGLKMLSEMEYTTRPNTVLMSYDVWVSILGIRHLPTRHRLIREMRKRNKNK